MKTGQDCLEASLCYPRIKSFFNYNFFFSTNVFLLLCFVCMVIIKLQTENLTAKLQNSNQNSTFSWVNLIWQWTTQPRSYALRLALIYILDLLIKNLIKINDCRNVKSNNQEREQHSSQQMWVFSLNQQTFLRRGLVCEWHYLNF